MGIQKAKLSIRTNKKGKVIGEIEFSPNSTMPVPPQIALSLDLNNKECEVERDSKGMVVRIICEGKELQKNVAPNSNQTSFHHQAVSGQSYRRSNQGVGRQSSIPQRNFAQSTTSSAESVARAPYNFIPLNKTVIEGQSTADFSTYHEDRLSGYIQCEIETVTPLYIRDTLDEEQLSRDLESNDNPDFFSPAGKYCIPGSSLRGMVRNLVEIISWGKIICDGERKLFFRQVGDMSSLGRHYREIMVDESDGYFPKVNAGFLIRGQANNYGILPSDKIEGTQFYKVNYDYQSRNINGTNIRLDQFSFREIYFEPVAPELHRHERLQLKYAKVTRISEAPMNGLAKGYIISSGDFGRKKHMHWIINDSSSEQPLPIDREVIRDYKNDSSRKEQSDLLAMLERNNKVPCFYLTDKTGKVICFGFTGMFRLAYETNINDHIPQELRANTIMDMCNAIFGENGKFASRVYFEDAELSSKREDLVPANEKVPKVLSTPKPTTFQHYLDQMDPKNPQAGVELRSLKHWDTDCNIRGHKLYWHKILRDSNRLDWEEHNGVSENDRVHTKIKPINTNAIFSGRIRFDNLTKEELGALLFALDLPENHYHKLGMGKPLGLGTVKITPKLHLCDRKKRYSELFAEDDWQLAENTADIKTYKDAFEKYILDRLSNEEKGAAKSLWEVTRLKHLKAMMEEPTNPDWNEITSYMQIEPRNEYKMRPVLPDPLKVKQQNRGRR